MPHPRGTSRIAELIDGQLAAAPVPDTDFGLSPCQTEGPCPLAPGIEHLFVTQTANYLVRRLTDDVEKSWEFRELVYCPHQRIEKKCGFDLSIGHFKRPNRVRTMHKLHYGTKQVHPWPDEDWAWSTLDRDAYDRARIKRHLLLLLDMYKARDFYEPFLVLHVCFCVHEYRRMGESHGAVTIPAFESPLRTVVVDLRPLIDEANYKQLINANAFAIAIKHKHEAKTTQAQLSGVPGRASLPVLALKGLGDRAVERAKVEF